MFQYIASLIIGTMVLFGGGLIAEKGNVNKTVEDFSKIFIYVKPSPIPTQTPLPMEFPTSFPTPTTYYVAPTIDPDPIVNCNININCGGGSKPLKKSVCDNSTCCQIRNNWYFYLDRSKCSQDQNSNTSSNSGPLVPLVTCVLSSGTYQLSQSSCDEWKKLQEDTKNIYSFPPLPTPNYSYANYLLQQSQIDTNNYVNNQKIQQDNFIKTLQPTEPPAPTTSVPAFAF